MRNETKDDQLRDLQYKTENHDCDKILKSFGNDSEYYKKENKSVNKKKAFMIVLEFLIGTFRLGVGLGLTISGLGSVGIVCASSISFLSSISTLITNEFFSKKHHLLYYGLG